MKQYSVAPKVAVFASIAFWFGISAFADQVIKISEDQTDAILVGEHMSPSTESTTVIVNEGVYVNFTSESSDNGPSFLVTWMGPPI